MTEISPTSEASTGLRAFRLFIDQVRSKLTAILVVAATALGVATTLVSVFGNRQEVAIRHEIAQNADVLEKAKAAKTTADSKVAAALADNARVKQGAEAKFTQQKAIVEAAVARYAERIKRAEADRQVAESLTAAEIARNADVKFKAEADRATLEALEIEHKANIETWLGNCATRAGHPDSGRLVDCSMRWSCMPGAGGAMC